MEISLRVYKERIARYPRLQQPPVDNFSHVEELEKYEARKANSVLLTLIWTKNANGIGADRAMGMKTLHEALQGIPIGIRIKKYTAAASRMPPDYVRSRDDILNNCILTTLDKKDRVIVSGHNMRKHGSYAVCVCCRQIQAFHVSCFTHSCCTFLVILHQKSLHDYLCLIRWTFTRHLIIS